jgi:hypothetical protein
MKYLGDFSATPPWFSMHLQCYKCNVSWTGCQDAMECPICHDADDYVEKTSQRRGDTPNKNETLVEIVAVNEIPLSDKS